MKSKLLHKILFVTIMVISLNSFFATIEAKNNIDTPDIILSSKFEISEEIGLMCQQLDDEVSILEVIERDCTVHVETDNLDVEITFHDVSWWECVKLKVSNWWYKTFH